MTHLTYPFEYAAPSGPPNNVNIQALSSTSLLITWDVPDPLEQNGKITGFEVQLTSIQNGTMWVCNVSENTLSLQVKG